MIKRMFTFAVIGFMAGASFAGCDKTSEKKVEEAKQDLKQAKAEYAAEWQQFKIEADQRIDANEKRIDQLDEKIEHAGAKLKAKYKNEVAVLKQRNHDLKKRLAEYKDEGKDRWETFKQGVSSDLDAVGKALKDLTVDKD